MRTFFHSRISFFDSVLYFSLKKNTGSMLTKLKTLSFISLCLCVSINTNAQWKGGILISYLGGGPNARSQYGAGILVDRTIADHFHLGGSARTWFSNRWHERSGTFGSQVITDAASSISILTDYDFGKKGIRPYLGIDAGYYFTKVKYENTNTPYLSYTLPDNYFGAAPKLGLRYHRGLITPFLQAQYHYMIGGGETREYYQIYQTGVIDKVTVKSYSSFFTVDLGILFKF